MSIDYLLKDGFVIHGAGDAKSPEKADIAIEGDRIREIGDLSHVSADKTISVKGLCVCPGFIDVHSHSDFVLLADGRAEGKIHQGITTEINGNCGLSAAPLCGPALEQREKDLDELNIKDRWSDFIEYFMLLERRKFAANFMTLVGHGNLRASAVGYTDKALSGADMERAAAFLRDAMEAGAKGLSTGLIYPPGIYSDTAELVELARETAKYKGIYTTHMRSEGDSLLESVDEVINIAEESKIRSHISHLKTSGEKNWKKLDGVFQRMERADKKGLVITCDRYPYIASSTDLDAVLPSWAFEGGRKREIERLKNDWKILEEDILNEHPEASSPSFWGNIAISSVSLSKNKWMEGKNILEVSRSLNEIPMKFLFDLLIEEDLNVGAIFFLMNEENLISILKRSRTMIGTDSTARSFDGITAKGMPHPRGFGSCPRILGRYVREQGILTLGEAVYKMSGLPAKTFHIDRRGIIAEGYFADITVFNPETVNDAADFNNPFRKPEGIYHVFVNGKPVLLEGEITGSLPGRILR
ncbi:MAG: D-aminoacylase [Thermodesulfovibrionia bacterium]|nr:D-aminoacylase [Thermodesulfovibrionia bacterium]